MTETGSPVLPLRSAPLTFSGTFFGGAKKIPLPGEAPLAGEAEAGGHDLAVQLPFVGLLAVVAVYGDAAALAHQLPYALGPLAEEDDLVPGGDGLPRAFLEYLLPYRQREASYGHLLALENLDAVAC